MRRQRVHGVVFVAGLALLSTGCGKATAPAFSPGSYAPDAAALGAVDVPQLASVVAGLAPQVSMYETEHHMLLFGAGTLAATSAEELTVNLRDPGSGYRSPCSYWFRVPIAPRAWEVGDARGFSVRLEAGQFEVAEGCTSPFTTGVPMVLTFKEPADGHQFMNAMAALEQHAQRTVSAGPGQEVEQ